MSDDGFTGLRPVAKKSLASELNRKTKRIVLPSSAEDGSVTIVFEPPRIIPAMPKIVVKSRFSLVAVTTALLEALPHGVPITPGWLYIGREPSLELAAFTALAIRLDGISKLHAAVTEFDSKPFVSDLGSTNGTRIFRNNEAIEVTGEPVQLHTGDILWLGSVFFQVVQS